MITELAGSQGQGRTLKASIKLAAHCEAGEAVVEEQ